MISTKGFGGDGSGKTIDTGAGSTIGGGNGKKLSLIWLLSFFMVSKLKMSGDLSLWDLVWLVSLTSGCAGAVGGLGMDATGGGLSFVGGVIFDGDGGLDIPPPMPNALLSDPPLPNAPLPAPGCTGWALFSVLCLLDLLLPDLSLPGAGDGGFDSIRAKGLDIFFIVFDWNDKTKMRLDGQ